MLVDKPERRRRNKEGAWGFGAKIGVGKISKGLGAWALSGNTIFSLVGSRGGKKR